MPKKWGTLLRLGDWLVVFGNGHFDLQQVLRPSLEIRRLKQIHSPWIWRESEYLAWRQGLRANSSGHEPQSPDGMSRKEFVGESFEEFPQGDGWFGHSGPFVVTTADCMPIAMVDPYRNEVALLHAGWRGVIAGIHEKVVNCFSSPEEVWVLVGPHIRWSSFWVKSDVSSLFFERFDKEKKGVHHNAWFRPGDGPGEGRISLEHLVVQGLLQRKMLPERIVSLHHDTFQDSDYHSYRRDRTAGRNFTLLCHLSHWSSWDPLL